MEGTHHRDRNKENKKWIENTYLKERDGREERGMREWEKSIKEVREEMKIGRNDGF